MDAQQNSDSSGVVKLNEFEVNLPEAEARTLFLAAIAMTRRRGALAISPSVTIAVNEGTQISLTIGDGFRDEYDPQGALHEALGKSRDRRAVVVV